ncbi:MAG: hypothetical protein IKN09_03160 [Clostridia bacterium]|nr:hypothetical protein [Clostridia bacterium]
MRKWVVVLLLVIVFVLSVISGFLVRSFINFSKKEERGNDVVLADNNENDNQVIDTSSVNATVSPNAEVTMTELFKKCGHTVVTKEIVPREIVNLDIEKVKEYYKDWNIDEFNSNEIKISRTNSGICNEHYVLRESDGFISINVKNDIGEYIFKGRTEISVQYLPEEDLRKFEQGIEVIGRDNLNKFLEDFE